MPKIPLYNQGLGQTVTTKPIQGIRANEAAFTSAQRGFSAFGKSIEDAAFQFGMEEKKAETERYRNKINTEVNQEMNNFTMSSEATTVAEYQALADKKRQELRNKHLSGLEGKLTKSQFSAVSMQFDNTFAAKVATGSQMAHAKGQQIRTDQVNTTIEDTLSQLRSLDPSSQLYQDIQANLDAGFDRWASQGLAPKYSKTTYRRELSSSRFVNDIENAGSQADIDKLRNQTIADRDNMSAADFAARNTAIDAQEKITDAKQVEASYQAIFQNKPNATQEELEVGIQTIRDGKVLTIETNAGENVVVDFSEMKTANREMLVAKIEARNKKDETDTVNANLNLIDQQIQSKSLSELAQMEKDTYLTDDNGNFVIAPDVKKRSSRQSIRAAINAEIRERAVRDVAKATITVDEVNKEVIAADGDVTPEMTEKVENAARILELAEKFVEADALRLNYRSTAEASRLFKGVEFASAGKTAAVLETARAEIGTREGAKTFEVLQKLVLARDKEIENDFVGYYKRKNRQAFEDGDFDAPEVSSQELIDIQTAMGIPPSKIRVTTNAQLKTFAAEYKAANITDKGPVMDAFLNSFGENQNRVMRHLRETNTVSMLDSVVAAYPNNANIDSVSGAGSEEGQELIKKFNTKDDLVLISDETATIMEDYGMSITGGFIDDTRGGGSPSRVFHNLEMRTIVEDTAAYIRASSMNKVTHAEAVKMAYDTVIGNNFVFPKVNDTPLRLPAQLETVKDDITVVLESSLNLNINREGLSSAISFPPPRADETQEQANEQYLNDLEAEGTWRTTTDNSGAYLVDQTGNLVKKSDGTGFVSVTFDDIRGFANGIPDIQIKRAGGGFSKNFLKGYFSEKRLF